MTWVKKKIGPGLNNITTVEEAEQILATESKLVLGFLDAFVVISLVSLANPQFLFSSLLFYSPILLREFAFWNLTSF